ncbi:DUF4349 domain-containing protein [Micromonospora sp. KC721]|uniref:DUF4349 domain-containing protein n=1 Tax=Micromonospora sp. KC721 TaxID=2530380 RepID=UPI0010533473|nr:DUF4349 domain-containing protein [Micromonospora sp. KC721]TDB79644.1 DUF4349 domain-containing protein [Micromonospora sp. KC721]
MGRRGRAGAGWALALAVSLLVGCSASDDSGGTESAAGRPAGDAAAGGAADAPAGRAAVGAAGEPGSAGAGAPDLRVDQRAIVYTGTLRVQVDDVDGSARKGVDAAARRAVAAATAAGGFVGGDQRRGVDADAEAELELRVPAARFTGFVEELAAYGRQQHREVRTQDVTEETVDLDARIATQRARVDSARRLLSRATSIGDLVSLENEVARREADLASLEARKRRLADLTALSTVTVTFVGGEAATPDEPTGTGFLVGLRAGWQAFVASMGVLATVLGALLPWLLALGVPVLLVLAVRRRWRRAATTAAGGPPASGGPLSAGSATDASPPVPSARSAP